MISHPELVYPEKLVLIRGVEGRCGRGSSAFSFTVKYYITINTEQASNNLTGFQSSGLMLVLCLIRLKSLLSTSDFLRFYSKDIVEKGFGNLKDRLNFRRMQVSSELALDGKLFVGFVALIYLSCLKNKMHNAMLFDRWTLPGVLDELDLIELFQAPEAGKVIGEVTK